MIPPSRRIWIYVPDGDPEAAEIVLLGHLDDIATPFAVIKSEAEHWLGFRNVEIVGGGIICGVLRVHLTAVARGSGPVGEVLEMFGDVDGRLLTWSRSIDWITTDSPRTGCVGTW